MAEEVHGVTKPLSLARIVPPPKGMSPKNANSGWYEWRLVNWGTKWDVDGPTPESSSFVQLSSVKAALCYMFDTAWAPPTPVISVLASRHPDLNFRHVFGDDAMAFAGRQEYAAGVLSASEEFSPSHPSYAHASSGSLEELSLFEDASPGCQESVRMLFKDPADSKNPPPRFPLQEIKNHLRFAVHGQETILNQAPAIGLDLGEWGKAAHLEELLCWLPPALSIPALAHEKFTLAPPSTKSSSDFTVTMRPSRSNSPSPLKVSMTENGVRLSRPDSPWSIQYDVFVREATSQHLSMLQVFYKSRLQDHGANPAVRVWEAQSPGDLALLCAAHCSTGKLWNPRPDLPAVRFFDPSGHVVSQSDYRRGLPIPTSPRPAARPAVRKKTPSPSRD